jgi:hypothetical protein
MQPNDLLYSDKQQNNQKKFIYRCMNKHELYNLLSKNIVEKSGMDHYGISFSTNRDYGKYMFNYIREYNIKPSLTDDEDDYFNYDFLVTFNRSIMESNFNMIEYEYTPEWFADHINLAWNYLCKEQYEGKFTEGEYNDVILYFDPDSHFHGMTEFQAYEKCLRNGYIDDSDILIQFPECEGLNWDFIMENSQMCEINLQGDSYHFIPGMVENVESYYPELLEELYNFLKDKLK